MTFIKGHIPWNKGIPAPWTTKRNLGNTVWKGKKHTEETKEKMRKNNSRYWLGKKQNAEIRNKRIKSLKMVIHSKEWNEKISKAKRGKPQFWFRGKNHWNWKGGIYERNSSIRHSFKYSEWRSKVYKRDNWTCKICKIKCDNKSIVAHHIKGFSEYPKSRFVLKNGITLCRSCHIKVHKNEKQRIKKSFQ